MSEEKRFLVGYDGSPGGEDALELARLLGSIEGGGALVVTVLPYGPLPVTYALLAEEQEEETEPLLAKAREKLAGLEVETRAYGGGSPAGVLNDLAEREEIEVIVVGSPHRGLLGRALIGSVAAGLLHGAPCAVVTAPRGYAEDHHQGFGTIAVAYDGSPEARRALGEGQRLAEVCEARLRVLTVSSPPVALPGAAGYAPPQPPDAERVNREALDSASATVSVEGRVLAGPAARSLAEACEDGVDLLLSGSRHYGPVTRVLLGSVSSQLIDLAPCPVLVVPRP